MKVPKILDDNREIASIWTSDEGGYVVGEGCTRIVVYAEPGPHCYLPYFAVYAGELLVTRVQGHQCQTITYATTKEG